MKDKFNDKENKMGSKTSKEDYKVVKNTREDLIESLFPNHSKSHHYSEEAIKRFRHLWISRLANFYKLDLRDVLKYSSLKLYRDGRLLKANKERAISRQVRNGYVNGKPVFRFNLVFQFKYKCEETGKDLEITQPYRFFRRDPFLIQHFLRGLLWRQVFLQLY
ncbi:MAG: hypothetical protein GY909_15930 [Oligoflexia bacterium]|nr:hypothetical protein [Oligoflexia bacterium]